MKTYRISFAHDGWHYRETYLIEAESANQAIEHFRRELQQEYPHLKTDELVIRARKAATRKATPEEVAELWELYWMTDISTKEIVEAYNDIVETVPQIPRIAGPFCGAMCCNKCGSPQYAWSRSDRNTWQQLAGTGWQCNACTIPTWTAWRATLAAQEEQARHRLYELKTMPYHEYLQTPEWAETRKAALRRAGYRCQTCNRDGSLHVHHRTYVRRGAEHDRDLVALCESCHQLFHDNGKLSSE